MAQAQGTPGQYSVDPAAREAFRASLRASMDEYFEKARAARLRGDCEGASVSIHNLRGIVRNMRNQAYHRGVYLSPGDRDDLNLYSLNLINKLPSECPPRATPVVQGGTPKSDFNSILVDRLVGDAHFAQFSKQCEKFDLAIHQLDMIASEGPNSIGVRRSQQEADLARRRAAELRAEGCPKGVARTVRSAWSFDVTGGASQVAVPQVQGGTRFDPGSGTEIPIASSASNLTGGSASFTLNAPTPNILWGDYFYISGGGSWFDGNSDGSVPIGATNVAQTYIFPNPASGSTGVFAGATGQAVQIDSSGHVIDISLGLKNDGLSLPFLGGPALVPQNPGPQVNWHTVVGLHYRHLNLSQTTDQQSLTFADLNSRIDLDQNSNFVGARFGIGVSILPSGSQPGFIGGVDAFISPGVLFTSGTATQNSNCGPCGIGSPEFNVSLREDFSNSHFSVIVGGSAHVGYRFGPSATLSLFGSVEHMTEVPFFNVPTTPTLQPINLDGRDSVTIAMVGGRLMINFNPPGYPPR